MMVDLADLTEAQVAVHATILVEKELLVSSLSTTSGACYMYVTKDMCGIQSEMKKSRRLQDALSQI